MDASSRIKQLMQMQNITEYRLAKLSGLSQSTISNIFIRNTAPTIPTIEAICNGLGISMAQFFCEDGVEEPVYLTKEQKDLFNKWISISAEQKDVVEKLIKSYKTHK
ncbi:MAG: helix-turn-helix transcriptional regulator [Oscillospiraceae bacterium]|nr:helix-turn-helix transcriptional regulator [Oscillospiraceae bacterium]